MKTITIVAAVAAHDAGCGSHVRHDAQGVSYSRVDLGGLRAGPEVPALRQGDPADSLYRKAVKR